MVCMWWHMGGGGGGGMAYGGFVRGVDFNMKFDGLFVVAYVMLVRELDFNVEVDGLCGGIWGVCSMGKTVM